jgi:hypothetical protein
MQDVVVPQYFTSGADKSIPEGTVVLMYPFPDAINAAPQVWQAATFLRFKMPGGRFNVPQPLTGTAGPARVSLTDTVLSALAAGKPPPETAALKRQLDTQLRSWGVEDVVAFPQLGINPAQQLSFLTWMLGGAPIQRSGAFVWYKWR